MPRPTKLTDDVQERVVKAIKAGNYADVAARYAGVHAATFHRWMKRGDPDNHDRADARYRRFREAVEQARAEAEIRDISLISQAARTNWRAAAWLLERRAPERWATARDREAPADGGRAASPGAAFRGDLKRLSASHLAQLQALLELSEGIERSPAADPPATGPLGAEDVWRERVWREGQGTREGADAAHAFLAGAADPAAGKLGFDRVTERLADHLGIPRPRARAVQQELTRP